MRLKVEDGIRAGMCIRGQREFCKLHGRSFMDFARHGIDVEELQGIEDAGLKRALEECAKREVANG